jgi:PAS domain S-box-containing protein
MKNLTLAKLRTELTQLRQRLAELENMVANHQETEAELRHEIEFSATVINAIPAFFMALDARGQPLMMNEAMLASLGYTSQEILGLDYLSTFVPTEEQHKVAAVFEQLRNLKQPTINESRIRAKDGRELLIEWHGRPVFRSDGQLDFIFAIGLDITKRQQADEALRESEARFRRATTSISDHIYMTEIAPDGTPHNLYISPNVATLTGYPLERFMAEWSFWPSVVIHPEDRAIAAAQAERLASGQNSELEYRLVRADGKVIWVRDSGRVENIGSGKIVYGVVGDVTQRRKAQEEIIRLYLAERDRHREAEALRQAALALVSTIDPEQVIERILAELQNVVPYDGASIQLLQGNRLKIIGGRGFTNLSELIGTSLSFDSENPAGIALTTLEPVIVTDLQETYPGFIQELYATGETRSWLGVPLYVGEKVIGVLTLEKQQPDFYTQAHAQLVMAYAAQAAVAIENARLHAETEKHAQQLTVLHELDRVILSSLRLDDVYEAFAKHIARLLPYDWMSIGLLDETELRVTYAAGLKQPGVGSKLPLKGSTSAWVIHHRQPVIRHNLSADPAVSENEFRWPPGVESVMILPLQARRQIIGVWTIGSRQVSAYDSDDMEIAQALADQLALGIENAQLYHQAQQEIADRRQAQAALELERASLAQRVEERTVELKLANAELARAARLKDEFLANMSHELRTPLNAILGFAEILLEGIYGPLSEDQSSSVAMMADSGLHLLNLINDILDLSKIGAGKLDLVLAPVSVELICQASLQFVQQQAIKKQLKIVSNLDQTISIIQADERRLKQILVNLLSNAVKFTPEDGLIGLDVAGDPEQQMVHFTVWDTGIGISSRDMERLFQPFVQLDSGLARYHEGTGLGLSLVYRLAKLHGGSVSAESEGIPGRGSRFTVSLPWSQTEETTQLAELQEFTLETSPLLTPLSNPQVLDFAQDRPAIPYPLTTLPAASLRTDLNPLSSTPPLPSPLLLLAEDNEANLKILSDYLNARGYRLAFARDGEQVLSLARETQPDLILMDMQMPGLDGLEATRRLRTDPHLAATPIIALTALAMPGDRELCLQAGANAYLSKPINLPLLVELIVEQLQALNPQDDK